MRGGGTRDLNFRRVFSGDAQSKKKKVRNLLKLVVDLLVGRAPKRVLPARNRGLVHGRQRSRLRRARGIKERGGGGNN